MRIAIIIGGLLTGIGQLIIQIIINKKLGVTGVGVFALFSLYLTPVGYFLLGSIRQRIASGLIENSRINDVLDQKIIFELIIYFVLCLLFIHVFELSFEYIYFYIAIVMMKYIDSLFELYLGYIQKLKSSQYFLIFVLIKLIFFVTVIAFSLNDAGTFVFLLFFSFLTLSLVIFKIKIIRNDLFSIPKISTYYKFLVGGIGFGVASLLMSFNTSVPRFFSEKIFDLKFLGAMFISWHFINIGSLLINAINQASLSVYSEFLTKNDKSSFFLYFSKNTIFIMSICGFGILMSYFFGDIILELIYDKELSLTITQLNLLNMSAWTSAFVYLSSSSCSALFVFGKQKDMIFSYAILLVVNVSLFLTFYNYLEFNIYLIYVFIIVSYVFQITYNVFKINSNFNEYNIIS